MKTKICSICKIEKLYIDFYYCSHTTTHCQSACKDCDKKRGKIYREKHKEKIAKRIKEWTLKNIEKVRKRIKNYELKNAERISKRKHRYYKNNQKRIQIIHTKYMRKARKLNINVRLLENLRRRLYSALIQGHKSQSTASLLGCTVKELKQHLEKQFQNGMTWSNYGKNGWEIDHIRPCASFDLSKPEEQKKCFHYTNLQPLWAVENYKKHDKIDFNYNLGDKND